MNLKMNLTYLLLLLGMVMFSNRAVYAQKGSAAIFQADATTNLPKRSAQDSTRGDLCLGLTTKQISYQSRLETRDKELEFIAMNRKYYRKDAEINKASPVVLNSSFGYYTPPRDSIKHLETKEFYLSKSKHQQTAAWVLLIGGTAMLIGGAMAFDKSWDEGSNTQTDILGIITFAGLVADVVSIPFFISASKNKKKAASLSFGNQNIFSPLDKSYCRNAVPSLTLRIRL